MDDVTLAAAFVAWGLVPGWALLRSMGVPWTTIEQFAAAPGLSIAFVAAAAYAVTLIGWPMTPVPVLMVLAIACVAVAIVGRRVPAPLAPEPTTVDEGPRWAPWLVLALPFAVVGLLEPVSSVSLLPPSLHDGLDHANWFRLIHDLGSVNPYVVMAPPLGPGGEPTLYPWGLHAWIALVARSTTADPVVALMQGMVAVSAAVPLSVYAIAVLVLGRGWPAVGAAAFSLFFWWLPFQVWGWGGYPLLAGAVAAPAVARVAIAALESRRPAQVVVVAFVAAGLVTIHPSQALFALVLAGIVAVALVPAAAVSRTAAAVLAVLLALGCGALFFAGEWWEPARSFLSKAGAVGDALSNDPRYRWPWALYTTTDFSFPFGRRVVIGALVAAGAISAVMSVRGRAVLALHVVFVALIALAPSRTALTSLWYHAPERLWYSQYVVYPLLASLGVSAIVSVVSRLLRGRIRIAQQVVWPAVAGAVLWLVWGPWSAWTDGRLFLYAQRNENLTITDRRVLDDFAWMRANLPARALLFNAPADWGLPLPFTGHRTVFWSGGVASRLGIDWDAILRALAVGGPSAASAASDLHLLGVDAVYAAVLDPRLERRGRLSLARAPIDDVPGLERVYRSPTARIFRVTGDGTTLLGLADSDRVRFARFHPIEDGDGSRWRWTDGDSRIYLQNPPAGCHVRVFGPEPDAIEVRVDGRPVALTVRGYPLPSSPAAEVEVAIVSPSLVPADEGTGADTRRLGVRVRDVGLRCGGLRE